MQETKSFLMPVPPSIVPVLWKGAAKAGKAVYCEKPTAVTTEEALRLAQICEDAGVKNGVVQDKLPALAILKLRKLIEDGFFGQILSVRGEFGYWVFTSIADHDQLRTAAPAGTIER